jgi:hypothetical protein
MMGGRVNGPTSDPKRRFRRRTQMPYALKASLRKSTFIALAMSTLGRRAQGWQGGPASVKKVPLSENQPLIPTEGAPKNQEKNANSCRW